MLSERTIGVIRAVGAALALGAILHGCGVVDWTDTAGRWVSAACEGGEYTCDAAGTPRPGLPPVSP